MKQIYVPTQPTKESKMKEQSEKIVTINLKIDEHKELMQNQEELPWDEKDSKLDNLQLTL